MALPLAPRGPPVHGLDILPGYAAPIHPGDFGQGEKIGYSPRMASNPQCRPRARARRAGAALAFALSTGLSACSSLGDNLPAAIGLPQGAPERPAAQPEFLPVHEMPAPRDMKPLTEQERKKVEADLKEARDRQERRAGKASLKHPAEKSAAEGQRSGKSPD
jgi:hypothetical protein